MAGGEYDLLTESAAESAKGSIRSHAKLERNSASLKSKKDRSLAKMGNEAAFFSQTQGRKGGGSNTEEALGTAANAYMQIQPKDDVRES